LQTIKPSWGLKFFGLAKFDKIIFDNHKISIVYNNKNTIIDIEFLLKDDFKND